MKQESQGISVAYLPYKKVSGSEIAIKKNKNILKELDGEKSAFLDKKASDIIESLAPDDRKVLEKECASQLNGLERQMFENSDVYKPMKFNSFIRKKFIKDSDKDVLGEIARSKGVDVGAVKGKIQDAEDVLKKYGVVYADVE